MIPIDIIVEEDGADEQSFGTTLQTAVDSLAHEALAPSTLAFIAAHDVHGRLKPGAATFGPDIAADVHRAGRNIWILTSQPAYDAVEAMGAQLALYGRDAAVEDMIDAAERAAARRAEAANPDGGPRDPEEDADQLREVMDARALAGLSPVLAILTQGPESDLTSDDLCESVVHVTSPGKAAEHFLMAFARDFAPEQGDEP